MLSIFLLLAGRAQMQQQQGQGTSLCDTVILVKIYNTTIIMGKFCWYIFSIPVLPDHTCVAHVQSR